MYAITAASIARRTLKEPPLPTLDWRGGGSLRQAQWTECNFELHATAEPDPAPDLDYLGSLSNTWKRGALHHSYKRGARNSCDWYHPVISVEEHRRSLRTLHYGRAEADLRARRYVEQDYQRLCDYNDGAWQVWRVAVKAILNGITLGHSWRYGVEDHDPDALTNAALEEGQSALNCALRSLEGLLDLIGA